MWERQCPICYQTLYKNNLNETVYCPCGKFVWNSTQILHGGYNHPTYTAYPNT